MSRIGKRAVPIPAGVEIKIAGQSVEVKGKRGTLQREFHPSVEIQQEGSNLAVSLKEGAHESRNLWGLSRTLLSNMVVGVTNGFTKNLEILGVGYKAAVEGKNLKLSLGYSHDILYPIPEGIAITVEKNTLVAVNGADREMVGRVCADLRDYRSPEPYKGKGVRYAGEFVALKVGKKKK